MKRTLWALLALGLWSCGDDGPVSSQPAESDSEYASRLSTSVVGQEWVLEKEGEDGAGGDTGVRVTLRFGEDGRVTGTAGCNSYFGAYEIGDGGTLTIGEVGSTRMACVSPEVMDLESQYLRDLGEVVAAQVRDGCLSLRQTGETEYLRFTMTVPDTSAIDPTGPDPTWKDSAATAAEALVERRWRLQFFEETDGNTGSSVAVPDDIEITALFSADGRVSGSAGCNQFFAAYRADDEGALAFRDVGITEMFCQTPEIMEWEDRFRTLLTSIDGYRVEGQRLILMYGDGSGLLHLSETEVTVEDSAIVAPPRPDLVLTASDSGDRIELPRPGAVVEVVLEANPSTGYGWHVMALDSAVVRYVGESFGAGPDDMVGAPGTARLRFEVIAPGEATLRLGYSRVWESVPPLETFEISFVVNGGIVPPDPDPEVWLTIQAGTSFGECMGYCQHELYLDEKAMVLVVRGWDEDEYPEKRYQAEMDGDLWQRLVELAMADVEDLAGMGDVIGCPDCADGGSEWVKLSLSGRQEKVTFEFEAKLEPIAELLEVLRALRAEFLERVEE